MSERASLWLLRLLALVAAAGLWYSISLANREQQSERVVDASVTYKNSPPTLILVRPVQQVRVNLQGSISSLSGLNPLRVSLVVDLARASKGKNTFSLGPENVLRPPGLAVLSVEPSSITLELDREMTRSVPIRASLDGEPAAGAVAGEPRVYPAQARIRGPETLVQTVEAVATSTIHLDGHAVNFEEVASVLPPDPVIKVVEPLEVRVFVPMELPAPPTNGTAAGSRARP